MNYLVIVSYYLFIVTSPFYLEGAYNGWGKSTYLVESLGHKIFRAHKEKGKFVRLVLVHFHVTL